MGGCCSCSGADDVSKDSPHGECIMIYAVNELVIYLSTKGLMAAY